MNLFPLKGVKVVNFGLNLPGPMLSMRLKNKGAEVLHIEPPAGDPTRSMFVDADGTPVLHAWLHAGSEVLSLDLTDEVQRRRALSECEIADVVIDSFLPGTLSKLGIDSGNLRDRNAELVYCAIVGLGGNADAAALPGHDINFLAASGLAHALGLSPWRKLPTFPVGDIAGGVLAAEAEVLAALYARSKSGTGRHIEICIADVLEGLNLLADVARQVPDDRFSAFLSGDFPCYRIYEAADNTMLALGALEPKFWARFCTLIGCPELIRHQFDTRESDGRCHQIVEQVLRSKGASEWEALSLSAPCCLTEVKHG
ncbi:CoA transferase [Pandoraea terrigena]|uniref:Carnitine dehydratase n=1 Tax=Pandoraea terrigena TaxID=2508292 RepID=A0A5E4WA86_9BURK|nr:CaiB/BaiF CoA-transferase family protein [Pandoraea terrigena]VVE20789.1 carnitine dehydratase [Pandoraea terrigena]